MDLEEDGNSAFYLSMPFNFGRNRRMVPGSGQKALLYPRAGDYMGKAIVIAPLLETLLKIGGMMDVR
jgi:hypothetical protein